MQLKNDLDSIVINFDSYRTPRINELRVLKSMLIHSQGADPMDVIIRRHPSEDEATFRWRRENYICVTRPYFDRAMQALYRIFADTTADWRVSANTEKYLQRKRFSGFRFDQFFERHVLRTMIEDPNTLLVTRPTLPVPESITEKIDVTLELVKTPYQYCVREDLLVWCSVPIYDLDKIHIYEHYYKSGYDLTYNLPDNAYFFVITPTYFAILKFDPPDKLDIRQPYVVGYYEHNIGELPGTMLGGKFNYDGYYDSYFSSFIEFGNAALRDYSDYAVVQKNCAYPIIESRAMDCIEPGCKSGTIEDPVLGRRPCHACGGTGKRVFTPTTILIRPEPEPGTDVVDPTPMLRYITPPSDILVHMRENWEKMLERALSSLNLNFIFEAQSGVAKALDRQELYSMIAEIGHNIYDNLIYDALYRIEKIRERAYAIEPKITKPSSYNIATEDALNSQFQMFIQVKGLDVIKNETSKRIMQKMHSGNPSIMRKMDVLIQFDPFINYDAADMLLMRESGLATEYDIFLHQRAYIILEALIQEKEMEQEMNRLQQNSVNDYLLSTPMYAIIEELSARVAAAYNEFITQRQSEVVAINQLQQTLDEANEISTGSEPNQELLQESSNLTNEQINDLITTNPELAPDLSQETINSIMQRLGL